MSLEAEIERILGVAVSGRTGLSGGCVGEVCRVELADGRCVVAKLGGPGSGLETEGWMLDYLAQKSFLPVPHVFHADNNLLLMSFIESGGTLDGSAQEHAAELLADLHGVTAPRFGLERDTLIGGLAQPNQQADSWRDFFRQQRLLYMGGEARRAGRLPGGIFKQLEKFAGKLEDWITEPEHPSLIHGDMWGGNRNSRLFAAGRRSAVQQYANTDATEPADEIGFVEGADVVVSRFHGLSPVAGTELAPMLRNEGVTTVVVAGVSLNVAIPNTVFDLVNGGFQVVVPTDGSVSTVAGYGEQVLEHTLAYVATLTDVATLVEAWSQMSREATG